jgi:thiosulfate reductase cytochrome b subunit
MSEKIYLYPIWLRSWHWLNALAFLTLIVTGLDLQYADPDVQFIPFNIAVTWHNVAGITMILLFIMFLVGNISTGNSKFYRIKRKKFPKKMMKQFRYYVYGVFKKEKTPYPVTKKRKFNPLQLVSYVAVMYVLMPLVIITGVALLYPEMIVENVFGWSGIHLTALLHIIVGFALSLFMVIHIYFCTFGHTVTSNFKGMIDGYHHVHIVEDDDENE